MSHTVPTPRGAAALPHPDVWRAHDGAGGGAPCLPTGLAGLDAVLPGGGWPLGALTEVLQPETGWREWRLLGPALAVLSQRGAVVLVGPPFTPHLSALAAQGVRTASVCWLQPRSQAQALWAAEQVLRSRDVAAVLWWQTGAARLGHAVGLAVSTAALATGLRRLQLAAQAGRQPEPPGVWALRPWGAQQQSSPAPLRLGLEGGEGDGLSVRLLKCRGRMGLSPLQLAAPLPPALGRVQPVEPGREAASVHGLPAGPRRPSTTDQRSSHAVDRPVTPHIRPRGPVAA